MPDVFRIPALSILLSLHIVHGPGQQTHLYIANDDHTAYFWTADDDSYREAFVRQQDYYIGLMETQNDTHPPASQHRYNCTNTLWVYEEALMMYPFAFSLASEKFNAANP